MKLVKSLALGGLALASIGTSFGALSPAGPYDIEVNITGSTAFRTATHAGIQASLPGYQVASNGTLPGASQATYTATVGGKKIIVRTSFSGSVGGLQALHGTGVAANFIDETAATAGATNATTVVSKLPNLAMADNSVAAAAQVDATLKNDATNYSSAQLGVIPFRFVSSPTSGLTNVTNCGFRAGILGVGVKDFFIQDTGAATPYDGTFVYFTGRNSDSGTRLVTFAVTGFGIGSLPYQFKVTVTGPYDSAGYKGTITAAAPFAINVANGAPNAGNDGESSGGTVAKVITAVNYDTFVVKDETGADLGSGPFLTYLGESDSNAAIAHGAVELLYNGVKFTASNIKNGSYQFWSYEYAFSKGVDSTFFTTLTNNIKANDLLSGYRLTDMKVSRTFEGLPVTPL